MNPTTEKRIQTSAGMETASETVSRIKSALPQTNTPSSIPVGAIESTAPAPLAIPTPTPVVQDNTAVTAAEQTLQQKEIARLQAEDLAPAQAKETESERRVRELSGVIGTEATKRAELETQAGIPGAQDALRRATTGLQQATAQLREFDLNNVNQGELARVNAAKNDITKRTFGAMSAEENIKNAVTRAGLVSSVYAQQASIQVMQDNLKGATDAIDKALTSYYEPIRQELSMEMMFLQRNAQRFDAAQGRLAQARLADIQAQQNQLDRIQDTVASALESGAATSNEAFMLADPKTTDQERMALAQLIKARGAKEMRDLQMQSARMDLSVKAQQLAKLREPSVALRPTSVIDVNGTKQLVDTQTGDVIATFGADVSTSEVQLARTAHQVNSVDILKNHRGMAKAVGTSKLARWTPFTADVMTGDVAEFTGSVENLVKNLTLNSFAEAKERGMTFGAMSEGEWKILGDSATKISSWRRERDDGSIFYDVSEKAMNKELDVISNFQKMGAIKDGVDPANIGVLTAKNSAGVLMYVTRNSDGSYQELMPVRQ